MKKLLILFVLLISSCKINNIIEHHGVNFLEKKQKNLTVNQSNLNDVRKLLGPPSVESVFDNNVLIYIERKITRSTIRTLGRKKILINDVLILEINNKGLLVKKEFYDKNKMNNLEVSKNTTKSVYKKDSFIYDFLETLRRKIEDPLGKRKK